MHVVALVIAGAVTQAPQLEFEFELPAEVEFGLTEEVEAASGGLQDTPPPVEAEATGDEGSARGSAGDAGVDAGPQDAGAIDAGPSDAGWDAGSDAESDAGSDTGPRDAGWDAGDAGVDAPGDGGDGGGLVAESLDGPSRIPPGAQIALRLDMASVRASPLAPEVRRLLAAIPDWQLILAGSGIDPLEDLERLLIASPNLQRARLVMAGRHAHTDEDGDTYIRQVVQRFSEARGTRPRWRTRHGVPVSPWPNEDETARVLAIIGPRHFTITRPQDLRRTLAIAQAREQTQEDEEERDEALERAAGADALLSMGEGDAFTIEVEGARQFLRSGNPALMPASLRAAVQGSETRITVRGLATFDSAEEAEAAQTYWNEQRERASRNAFVRLTGLDSALSEATLELEGRRLRIGAGLSLAQARLVLGYLEGAMRTRARRRARSSMRGRPRDMRQTSSAASEMGAAETMAREPAP